MSIEGQNRDPMALLQQWYAGQCDGDWEHTYGIKIDTIDNPGWILTIDLAETPLSGQTVQRQLVTRNELDWVQYEVADDKFMACGGPFKLEELIRCFLCFSGEAPAQSPT